MNKWVGSSSEKTLTGENLGTRRKPNENVTFPIEILLELDWNSTQVFRCDRPMYNIVDHGTAYRNNSKYHIAFNVSYKGL